ncbi:hypothetical protein PYW07_012440 [Mythimna separata]|uniref:Ketosynthase family 3 (KS3) domain-containing protein n=1 Tax=Mythimna separata TaxID=271217 RepID=A0AAD7YL71_MYTSE|nr:hypothetical protein PYW07_012440 [Mythimna separata]
MAPNPQEGVIKDAEYPELRKPETQLTGDEVVISGISGLFPRSDNVEEFMENLYNGVDMVTSEGTFNHPQFPKHLGKVDGFDEFDNQFFGVPHGQVQPLNPMCRKVLENAYEALFDAGVNPKTIAGTKVAVYSGASFIDVANSHFFDITQYDSNYIMTGSSKSMLANRISYWLDSKGPSYAIDATCSSSIVALGHAYRAIKEGGCSSAIVTGSNMCLDPKLTINLRRAGFLCLDGKTKCFDKNGDGFVRSEAVGVLFLQKASDAKRIYAEVVHTKEKYSALPDSTFLPVRKSDNIENFLCEFYSEVNVHPKDVEYLEAFGVAIQSGDENELEAISRIFARDSTVKVGCVKSNMGHSEGASDLCALIKVCLAYHKGQLPANLHYKEPQNHIPAIKDGKIQVVTETTPFKRGYTAINSFSYSGINQHTLMKGHYKKKNLEKYSTPIPRLVLVSGRLEESVSKILDSLKSHPVDAEQIALLHNFFAFGITGHTCRGYVILDTNKNNETISLGENVNNFPGTKAPVWFLYSGMGSQWLTMGAGLMTIPTFAASIERYFTP